MVFIIVLFSGLSIIGLYIVRRLVPVERLKLNHEVAGVTFGVSGAFYGLDFDFKRHPWNYTAVAKQRAEAITLHETCQNVRGIWRALRDLNPRPSDP